MKATFGFVICMSSLTWSLTLGGCAMPGATPGYAAGLAIQYGDVQRLLEEKCTSCHTGADAARGLRLDIAAGTAVRFEPGQRREVALIPIDGARRVFGFNSAVMGDL